MTNPPRPTLAVGLSLAAVVAILVISGGAVGSFASPSALPTGGPATSSPTPTAAGPSLAAGNSLAPTPLAVPGQYIESGRGTFFTNLPVPNGTTGHAACVPIASFFGSGGRDCFNATVDPSLNLTTLGTTALAYTTFTNDSPCAAMRANATTEIGLTTSTTLGSRWTPPRYLGNPVCSTPAGEDQNYSDAMEPSLTSLANGTLVLAYVEYNITNVTTFYQPIIVPYAIGCEYTLHNRIVVAESYDNGTTWTTPTVLAETDRTHSASSSCSVPGIPLLRPSATATGDTVYVAWMNDPYPYDECCLSHVNYTGTLALAVSTNGGGSWTNGTVPPTIILGTRSPFSNVSAYPDLLVTPSGQLFLSYATGFDSHFECNSQFCGTIYNATLIVARSTDNGSTFRFTIVSAEAGTMETYSYFSEYLTDPLSQLAFDPVHGRIDVVYSSGAVGRFCSYYPGETPYCDDESDLDDIFFSSTANGGATWSTPTRVAPSLSGSKDSPYNVLTLGSVAIASNGTIEVAFSLENDSQCDVVECNAAQEIYVNSTDDGRTWSQPALVDTNFSYVSAYTCTACNIEWMGTSSATVSAGDQVLIAWPQLNSPNGTYSSWGTGPASVEIETSRLFTGAGVNITFNETGLPAASTWNVSVGGFVRDGPSGTNLTISGVPPAFNLTYWGPWTNVSAGVAYAPAFAPASPGNFASNAVVAVTYHEEVAITIATIPFISTDSYYWLEETNFLPSPLPGTYWTTIGTPFTASMLPNVPIYCYPCINLTLLSWTGTGAGSVNVSASSVTLTPLGPLTESASFSYPGYCYPTPSTCTAYNFSQSFSESGLPTGTPWGVTVLAANGSLATAESTGDALSVNVTSGLVQFAAWDVPAAQSGVYWVPTASAPSTELVPTLPITVHYALALIDGTNAPGFVRETGLPNGTSWSLQVGAQDLGTNGASLLVSVPTGASLSLNASPVYFENGTGAYLSKVTVSPLTANATSTVLAPGGSLTPLGGLVITFAFSPDYLVTPIASSGGSVAPAPAWVDLGGSLDLTATAAPGYHFLDWTGTGSGSVSGGTSVTVTVSPRGAVTEFATFRGNFAPTWNLTVDASGFGPSTPFTIVLGGVAYSGSGSARIGNLSTGAYSLTTPMLGLNGSNTSRLVIVSVTASTGLSGPMLQLSTNVTLDLVYQVEYTLSVFATPGGSILEYASGTYWVAPGPLTLTAQPGPSDRLVAWSGTVSGTDLSITVPITGASNETAQFGPRPIVPVPVFALTATETGLPAAAVWSVSVGGSGAFGSSPSLTIGGLNGSYLLTAPTVFGTTGIRYVSDEVNVSEAIASNVSVSITFTTEYLVTVVAGAGGSVTPTTSWLPAGSSVTLTAAPNGPGMVFDGWGGPVNGTDLSLTFPVTGPVTEFATFGPAPTTGPAPASEPSRLPGLIIGLVALAALLVVGLLVMRALGRRPPALPPEEWESGTVEGDDVYPAGPMEFGDAPDGSPTTDGTPPMSE